MRILTRFTPFSPLAALGAILLALTLAAAPLPAFAQNLFRPVAYVNNDAITGYELQQRILLLQVLRTPGDLESEALKRLINERLQRQAGAKAGITLTDDDIRNGVDEFARRVNLTGDEFLANLQSEGVAPESFYAFVEAGLAWREVVRARFGAKTAVTEAEIDRAIELEGTRGSARVLISEIFLPTNTPKNAEITRELAPQIARLRTIEEFADAARRFSAGASRENGGRVENWVPIENLPALIRPVLLTMRPGEVTEPIEIPNALALFQLRAIQETTATLPRNPVIDYAAYYIDGGRSPAALERAAEVRAAVNTCDDLYGVAKGQPPEVLERSELALSGIPRDVALELAKLDPNESSTALTRADGQTLVFLMLCSRRASAEEPSRDDIRTRLQAEKLALYAEAYLDELRANAAIRKP